MSRMSPLNVRAAGAGARRDPRTAGPAAGGRRGAGGRIPTRRPPRGRASSASAGTTTAVRCRARRFVRSRVESRAAVELRSGPCAAAFLGCGLLALHGGNFMRALGRTL